jgi:hypothetical protein
MKECMRIVDPRPISQPSTTRTSSRRSSDGSFATLLGEGEAAKQAGASSGVSAPSIANLLTLQSLPDPLEERRRAHAHARDILDDLEAIRRGLLLGSMPLGQLQAMLGRLKTRFDLSSDPKLADIVADVELRLSVELAKFGLA